ncbi:DUF4064 domain-containing protein [Curtobacterium sp. NPDC090217]|uniref:DUF4064 domain-containing protein n=1 Tax=Curtobacterium sp. NPDC090217 TaxID=3363970 RepID=UPI00382F6631
MTNDDRSNEDRPGDGQAPTWGEPAPQQPAAPQDDAPRYGERITPASAPQYGEQAAPQQPQYGEQAAPQQPQYGQQQYGQQQPQYGQQQYGQQQYDQQQGAPTWGGQQHAAAAPASAGAPGWQSYEEPKAKKKTVGVIAFVLGLVALVVGVITGYLFGTAIVHSSAFDQLLQNGGSTTPDPSQFQDMENDPALAGAGVLFLLGTVIGLWALVQGIIAIATKRGRGWGVFAVVLAIVAVIAVLVTYAAVAAVAVSNGVS